MLGCQGKVPEILFRNDLAMNLCYDSKRQSSQPPVFIKTPADMEAGKTPHLASVFLSDRV